MSPEREAARRQRLLAVSHAAAATRADLRKPEAPRLRLVVDRRPGVFERRRADCRNLPACESAWILAYGGEQARCPEACASFEARA